MSRAIVADAGPLIALARIGRMELLSGLFEQVLIPEAVREELKPDSDRPGACELRLALAPGKWLKTRKLRAHKPLGSMLDAGENQAILLALQVKAPLLIDDLKGRRVGIAAGLPVIGTGRILIEAKKKGLIEEISPVLEQLAEAGYRISERLVKRLLELSGEG